MPGKNLARLGGRSLLARAVECGIASGCDRVFVTTDSERYAQEGRRHGADVLRRPGRLARDSTAMTDVVVHAVRQIERAAGRIDAIVLLQPTSPFRTPADVDACLRRLRDEGLDSVVSVVPVPARYNPHTIMLERDGSLYFPLNPGYRLARRQDFPPAYLRNGAVYAVRAGLIRASRPSLFGRKCAAHVMRPEFAVNVDLPADLRAARKLWKAWARLHGSR